MGTGSNLHLFAVRIVTVKILNLSNNDKSDSFGVGISTIMNRHCPIKNNDGIFKGEYLGNIYG